MKMEEQKEQIEQPKEKKSKVGRVIGGILIALLLFFVGLPLSLYIPFVQDVVCNAVVSYLNKQSDDLEYKVGKVRIGFPLKLKVQDVDVLKRADGKTLIHVGELSTGLDDIPINQPYFVLNKVHVEDVVVGMDSLTESFGLSGTLKSLDAARLELDLSSHKVRLQEGVIESPDVKLYVGPSPPDSIDEEESLPWSVSVGKVAVHNGRLGLDMSDESLTKAWASESNSPYLDYNHLLVSDIDLEAENISYTSDKIHADVKYLKGREENCGLEVNQLAAKFNMEDDVIALNEVDLGLGDGDYLRGDVVIDLDMLDSIPSGSVEADLEAQIDSANLCRLAAPYLPNLQKHWVDEKATVALKGRVTPDSLDVRQLSVEIPNHVDLTADAVGTSIFDNKNRQATATVKGSLKDADFLVSALVDEQKDRMYRLPKNLNFDVEGSQRGQRFTARADVQHNGRDIVRADGNYDLSTEAYHLDAKTRGLNVSEFVPGVIADRMTATVLADGRHFDFPGKRTRVDAKVQIDSLHFVDNTGRRDSIFGVSADASMIGGNYVADIHSQHKTLAMDTHLEGIFLKDTISTKGHIKMPNIDLAQLPFGLARTDLGKIGLSSTVEGYYDWGENAHLQLKIDSLKYADARGKSNFDDIIIGLESSPGMMDISLIGGDANVMMCTDRSIKDLPAIVDTVMLEVNRQLNNYEFDFKALVEKVPQLSVDFHMAQDNPFYDAIVYNTGYEFKSIDVMALNAYRFSLDGTIVNVIDETGSVDFDTIAINIQPCKYENRSHVPQNAELDSIAKSMLPASNAYDAYQYAVHAMHIDPKASSTYDVHLGGKLMSDSVTAGITYINGNYLTVYDAEASVAIADDSVTLHLEKDPTIFEQQFTVNKDNYLSVMHYKNLEERKPDTKARIILDGPRNLNMRLYTRKNTQSVDGNQLLFLVRNLDLAYATNVMQWEGGDAGGNFNLTAAVDLYPDSIGARLRSGIKSFHLGDYKADTLSFDGNVAMAEHRRDAVGTLTVDSIVKLFVDAKLADSVNVKARIDEFPLPLVNTFLPSNINLWGNTTGLLTIRGRDFDSSKVNAHLTMQEAGVVYDDLDARLKFCEDTLYLRNNKLSLNNYKIFGANSNPIFVRGMVDLSEQVSNPGINLNITGDRVRLIDNTQLRLKDQYITGRLPITPNIKVRGTLNRMDVSGSLRVHSGTNLTYYMSDDPLLENSRIDDIVEFVNFRQQDREMAQGNMKRRQPLQDQADEGMKVRMSIDIDKDVKITAILDAENNKVDIVGGGGLSLQTDNQGEFIMNGTYDIVSGKVDYKLPILPMVKTFDINSSSVASWSGDAPDDPEINILASEEIKATVNTDNKTSLVNFIVTIAITGTLEDLHITFDCSAANNSTINSGIASLDEDERSKVALILLISQTYTGPGGSSSAGLGVANAALSSMINRQLESLIGNMKGTTIDIGVDTYNTESGTARTDYSVKVTKTLFNDRVRATIGGQVSSGGDVNRDNGAQLGDMSVEYLIKKDGSHYIKVYRRTNYESVLEGEVIEAGASYIQEQSGYRFKQLLLPTSRKRMERIEQHIRELQLREEEEDRQAREGIKPEESKDIVKPENNDIKQENETEKNSE
jgi:hypothetical protein